MTGYKLTYDKEMTSNQIRFKMYGIESRSISNVCNENKTYKFKLPIVFIFLKFESKMYNILITIFKVLIISYMLGILWIMITSVVAIPLCYMVLLVFDKDTELEMYGKLCASQCLFSF